MIQMVISSCLIMSRLLFALSIYLLSTAMSDCGELLPTYYVGLMSQPYIRTSSTSGSPFDYSPGVGVCVAYEPSQSWSHKYEMLLVPYHSPATERRPAISSLGFRTAFLVCYSPIYIESLSSKIGVEAGIQLSIDEYLTSGEIGTGSISLPLGICWSMHMSPFSIALAPRIAMLFSNGGLDGTNSFLWFVTKASFEI